MKINFELEIVTAKDAERRNSERRYKTDSLYAFLRQTLAVVLPFFDPSKKNEDKPTE